jgi:RimJ/RimL family protein N-acetyltransferase
MPEVRLRAVRADDLDALATARTSEADPFEFFGFQATNGVAQRFAANGLITDDFGQLAVEDPDGHLVGHVGWFAVQHGPSSTARALNVGISLLVEHRGRGYGTAAQAALADYLFANTLIERLEATTDVDNVAEQRALTKAGFHREGIIRHGQFRAGAWHDLVTFSRLRGDLAL